MKHLRAKELFNNAIIMFSGHGTPQERLLDAVREIGYVNVNDLPEELKAPFDKFRNSMTVGKPTDDEGTYAATIRDLSDDEIGDEALKIVAMYGVLSKYAKG